MIQVTEVPASLQSYRSEVLTELGTILHYWTRETVNPDTNGFFGSVNYRDEPDPKAPGGIVMYSRICWSFSAAYQLTGDPSQLAIAKRAYRYILDCFEDQQFGGVYWSVDHNGQPLDDRKQIYGLAFCIYGLSEYYRASADPISLDKAISMYEWIEKYSFDKIYGGYLEAFTRDGHLIDDMRLSEKDDNEKKTMNTHLHIVEAYANLFTVWPDNGLRRRVLHLLDLFEKYFVDSRTHHLRLFFDEVWNLRSGLISYGHDIEAAWLLADCAGKIGDQPFRDRLNLLGCRIAEASAEGLDVDGGLWYEFEPDKQRLIREKHSWPQAEAMVGFLFAWEQTGDERFLRYSTGSWEFVKKYLKDKNKGEWWWGVLADYSIMPKDKAGFWKCPYHNTRACLEIIKRIDQLEKN